MKLALGTAQFGLFYGVANTMGQVSLAETSRIMALALSKGIDTLDTAIAYGESEAALGRVGVNDWKLITKLPALPESGVDAASWVEAQIEASLARLGVQQLHAVLLHRPKQLFGPQGSQLFQSLQDLVTAGTVQKIGVSVYAPEELDTLFSNWDFGLVQAPMNVLDRRMLDTGWARRLRARGVELHTRSTFLQGLLLMRSDQRPAWFDSWQPLWASWARWLDDNGLTALQACLRFALSQPEVDRVLVGVDSAAQLQSIIDSIAGPSPDYSTGPSSDDPILLNPACWNFS